MPEAMTDDRPNIILIMTDEQRGDALGIEGHPVLQTPYLDALGTRGAHFRRAYSACPVCVPARRTLLTGAKPASHGVLMNYDTPLDLPTLPETLSDAGYQTHLVGKLHMHPPRRRYGFQSSDWADSPAQPDTSRIGNDYQRYLVEHGQYGPDISKMDGAHGNGWVSRPFALEERYHYTNWAVDSALRFLERRDPTAPFFLNLSIFAPHAPCTPPAYYFQKYMDMDIPPPVVGDWAKVFDAPQRGLDVNAWRVNFDPIVQKQYAAGYYGCIEHIDHQIGRVLARLPRNTVILFVSDHGEMLGDHQWIRKRSALEGSARVPFLLKLPASFGVREGIKSDALVELMDVMPTLLDAAGVPIPDTVDGRSVLPLLRGEESDWRTHLHGECSRLETLNSGMQFIVDERWKYIYHPGTGIEHLFDLEADPQELVELSGDPAHEAELARLRGLLIAEIDGRPENFVQDGRLAVLGGPTPPYLPGHQRPGDTGSTELLSR